MSCIQNSIIINNIPSFTNIHSQEMFSIYLYRYFIELLSKDFTTIFNLNTIDKQQSFNKRFLNRLQYINSVYKKYIPTWTTLNLSEDVSPILSQLSNSNSNSKDKALSIFKNTIDNTDYSILNTINSNHSILITFNWLKPLKEFQKSVVLLHLTTLFNNQLYRETLINAHINNLLDIQSVHNRLELDYYILPNRQEFLPFLQYFSTRNNEFIKPYNSIFINNKPETFTLFKQQRFVTNYLNENSPYRGLLLYHGLGSGKSGASIATAEGFKTKNVIVMTPSSLQSNYIQEIKSFGKISYRYQQNWCFTQINPRKQIVLDILKKKGIPLSLITNYKDTKNTIVINKNNKYGIWTINVTNTKPNFTQFSKPQQKEILKTIDLLINHKYTFINYNGGRAVFKNIFTKLFTKKQLSMVDKLITKEDRKQIKKNDNIYNAYKTKILNKVFSPDNDILTNPFDNKVLVIDEVHNLISMMTKANKLNAPYLYELIMRATNLSIICLSGTPFINSPFELAILFNLLQGNITSYSFSIQSSIEKMTIQSIKERLNKLIYIDRVEVNQGRKPNIFEIQITKLPKHFIRKYPENDNNNKWKGQIIKSSTIDPLDTYENFKYYLQTQLQTFKLSMDTVEIGNFTSFMPDILLPNNTNSQNEYQYLRTNPIQLENAKKEFFETYVEDNKIKEKMSFYVRTMGLVSFYSETSEVVSKEFVYNSESKYIETVSKFPTVKYTKPDRLPLTIYQLLNYVKKREKEITEDENARQQAAKEKFNDKIQTSFRSNTRQICNFGFPPTIPRFNKNELNEKQLPKLSNDNLTPRNLLSNPKDLTIISLDELSKKYSLCVNRILQSTGLNLCYSQYRTVEGLEILGRILKQIGYQEYDYTQSATISTNNLCRIKFGKNIFITSKVTNIKKDNNQVFYQFENLEQDFIKSLPEIANDWLTKFEFENKQITIEYFISKMKQHLESTILTIIQNQELNKHFFEKSHVNCCCFSFWNNHKNEILSAFNKSNNQYGQQLQVLFITQSGAEGLNLKNVRYVHIIEPYWNRVRIEQVVGRARRVGSHLQLPPEQHNVTVYEYHSVFPNKLTRDYLINNNNEKHIKEYINSNSNYNENSFLSKYSNLSDFLLRLIKVSKKDNFKSTEEALYAISLEKNKLSQSFLSLVKNIAIDCLDNYEDNEKAESNRDDYHEITCFNTQQKNKEILSRNEYNYNLGKPDSELQEVINRSMNIYLVNTIEFFSLPIKYLSLQNQSKQHYHPEFEFWSNSTFFGKSLMMIKANNYIVNFYQYLGLDPLYNSFVNPLLRKTKQITNSIVIGNYNSNNDTLFNGKHIQLQLGKTLSEQKAYTIYLYLLQQFIINIIETKQLDFSKETVLNSDKFTSILSTLRKEIRHNFFIQLKVNKSVIQKKWSQFTTSTFQMALQQEIIPNKLTIQNYLLFLYSDLQSKITK